MLGMHRPGSYGTNEPLKMAQDLSWGDEKDRLTDPIPKHVHEHMGGIQYNRRTNRPIVVFAFAWVRNAMEKDYVVNV